MEPDPPVQLLLVEDSRGDRSLIRTYLASAGPDVYAIAEAASLAEAEAAVAARPFDIILLDLGLPDSWGLQTLHAMYRAAPRTPIVVFTGASDERQAITAIQEGAKDYLVKGPLTQTAIVRTLRYTLERSRLEAALRESEEKFRTMADFSGEWGYWLGPDGRYVYVNPACLEITGYSPEEFLADPGLLERIVHPRDLAKFLEHRRKAFEHWRERARDEIEFRIVRRDGQVRWIGHVCHAVVGAAGEYRGRRVSNRDITDHYDSLRLVARARDFNRTLLEDFPAPIWRCGPDGRYQWFNNRWLELTGRTLAQEASLGAAARVHPADLEAYLRTFRAALAARAPMHAEYRLRGGDGAWHWVIDSGVPIRDLEGEYAGYLGVCLDITERKSAEAKVHLNESRLVSLLEITHHDVRESRNLLEVALDRAIALSESGVGELHLYDQDRELFTLSFRGGDGTPSHARGPAGPPGGCEVERLLGIVVRQRHSLVVNDCAAFLESGGTAVGPGSPRRWMGIPVMHEGRLEAVIGVADKAEPYDESDVVQTTLLMEGVWRVKAEREATDEVRRLNAGLEARVVQRTAELGEAMRELESFSYSVSHDLRAPLRSLDGFSQALLEEYGGRLDATAHDYLRRIRAASLRMARLIDDLLQLSRVSRHAMVRERVDLSALALQVVEELRQREPGREVMVVVQPGLAVAGDPHLLRIALENLVGNAWKFTGRAPAARVEIGGRVAGGRIEVFVRDNGAGFDQAYADKLFVAFQRLHSAAEFPGTGVGLTTVRRILQRHGGEIRAEGRPGSGATFTFVLPAAEEPAEAGGGGAPAGPPAQ